MTDQKPTGLCFRCEHRAVFFETGRRPRCECGDVQRAYGGCYMFVPCRPVVTVEHKIDGDLRPRHGGYFGTRERAVRLADQQDRVVMVANKLRKGEATVLWTRLSVSEWRANEARKRKDERDLRRVMRAFKKGTTK